jgi:hypothetical protein
MKKFEVAKELLRWGEADLSNEERIRWKRRVKAFLNGEDKQTTGGTDEAAV